MTAAQPGTHWDPQLYQGSHSFVWKLGASVVELLAPQSGERILDLGCGTGQLTAEIAKSGADVVGIDNSAKMLDEARRNHPGIRFQQGDARTFAVDEPFDALFSNAVLHWVKPPEQAVGRIHAAIKPGGRFVAEFGGRGNTELMQEAFRRLVREAGISEFETPWYFPGIGEYASLLEAHGFEVTNAALVDRPTALDGEHGLRNWFEMFLSNTLDQLPTVELRSRLLEDVEGELRPRLYRNGTWYADYRRLRLVARRL
ncbi:MAG: methyltransferase domain-containing protein [Planctomycetota bacterium]|nr:methyltransferase domain-containing protein [Planctomycetota bacterium]